MKYLILIFFCFIIFSLNIVQAKDNNYKKLKEIEKKLLVNQEVYLELLKIEKELQKSKEKFFTEEEKIFNLLD